MSLYQGNHAVIIRGRDLDRLARFYADLGFVELKRMPDMVQFDSGDPRGGGRLEIGRTSAERPAIPPVTTRKEALTLGVFETRNLEQAVENARQAGATILDTVDLPHARLTYVADPEWNVIGLRQMHEAAEPVDLLAGNLLGIGWIVLRARNREALAEYYKQLGFEEYGRSEQIIGMHIGDGAILEIGHLAPDAPERPLPRTRTDAPTVAIVGAKDSDSVAAAAKAAGAPWAEMVDIRGTHLWYICDPEGNVIGVANGGPAFPGPSRKLLVERLQSVRANGVQQLDHGATPPPATRI